MDIRDVEKPAPRHFVTFTPEAKAKILPHMKQIDSRTLLSNEELLEIMSKVKQPLQILPYIRKLFGNIESLDIDLKDNILAIVSREGEHFKLR